MTEPRRGMVLAAGLGLRMRPFTDRMPKPLLPVAGRTLLDRALDHLDASGVDTVVVNTHHLADQIAMHLAARSRPRIVLSHEAELLETGGGVAKALPHLAPGPFYVVNGDALWLDAAQLTLRRLAAGWDDRRMDALLLIEPVVKAVGYEGIGDFHLMPDGRLRRRAVDETAPYFFTGIQLLAARLFAGVAVERFSLNRLYDRALSAGRLFAVVHDGAFFHVGTPAGLALAEAALTPGGHAGGMAGAGG
ncbi:MAG TPA: nucleotidyltransferase family protein [Alphaproteobacteria bacterium]|nr:nucleotidyltransferase family protein [Alphaproteobacteria bacterium]